MFFFFKQKTAYEMLRSLVGSEMCIRDSPPNASFSFPILYWAAAEKLSYVWSSLFLCMAAANTSQYASWCRCCSLWRALHCSLIRRSILSCSFLLCSNPVSYTHLTLPTKRIV
eukprot:TRINITY_DN52384_c0_g1_i1.p1 TRINITY_DN52384_c0_g1~~TRINITY_DN52384_c0_g1_i1.p1  ORF type:complete len:113 (-),score=24.26 TRINITY_DN52384_c0_g1_i1:112-450(-)